MSQAQRQIPSVYPEVAEFYNKTGLFYEPKALDRTRLFFDAMVKNRENEIVKRIDQIYRYKAGGKGQEYIYYNEQWEGPDHVGNKRSWGWVVGKVEVPYAHYEWQEETHSSQAVEIEGYNTKYSIPFNEKSMKDIENTLHDGTQYLVTDGSRTYGGGITHEMFNEWSFEDLVYYIKTGMKPGTQLVTPDIAENATKLEREKQKLDAEKQRLDDAKIRKSSG